MSNERAEDNVVVEGPVKDAVVVVPLTCHQNALVVVGKLH